MPLLRVTSRCNQACRFCSYPSDDRERRPGLRAWLKELPRSPGGLVQISGGEPLLRRMPDLLALLAACARRGIQAEFQTNAVLLAGLGGPSLRRLAEALRRTGGYFNVNYPAHTPALDARITGARAHFRSREAGVRLLLQAGAQVRLTHVINALNYRSIPAFVTYVQRRLPGVGWIQFSFVKASGRAVERSGVVPTYREVSGPLTRGLRAAAALGITCEVDHIPVCFIPEHWACHVDVRKVLDGKPGPHQFEKRKPARCAGCGFFRVCAGPRLDYLALHPDF